MAPPRPARGVTLVELLVAATLAAVLLATFLPVLQRVGNDGKEIQSLKNLQLLGEAHACYGADWEGRQFSVAPRLLGTVDGDCATYKSTVGCPNPLLLGSDAGLAAWGFYLGSGSTCSWPASIGSCSNMAYYRPIAFGTADGIYRVQNARGFQEYVAGKFYHPTWYSPLDEVPYSVAEAGFPIAAQFPGLFSGAYALPTYVASPAALYHPGVFRRPSQGGFRHPDQDFDEAYEVPSQEQCLHPSLKTRMIEHHWLAKPPGPLNPALGGAQPYYFNHGIESKPGTLFFDGSIQRMKIVQAVADDARLLAASNGVDGFWSRDTPFGSDGYFGAAATDDTRNSFHILTTDGILGRDFASRVTPPALETGGNR